MDALTDALWAFLTGNVVPFLDHFWSLLVVCTLVPFYATRGLKVFLKDYVEARYGKGVRPFWYRTLLFMFPIVVGGVWGPTLGFMESTPYGWAEGLQGGVVLGGACTVVVKITKRFLQKRGILDESTSQDLTIQPMPAIRSSDIPTDPIVTDPTKTDDL